MDLPTQVRITRCATASVEIGRIETLSREVAKRQIDAVWWRDFSETVSDPSDQPDRDWEWRAIVSRYQNRPNFRAVCVMSGDSAIQAAMLFRVDAYSALESGQRAVFVERLASAPRNRQGLVANPLFRGGGTGLLVYAIVVSYSLGLSGRVNLIPVANEDFYLNFGFVATPVTQDQDVVFELSASTALATLKERGLLDD
jgi:hypothetical protein